jgi:Pup amidohydrolase
LHPGETVELVAPVKAMTQIAGDVTCRVKVATKRGDLLTAVEIQRRYLELTEQHQNADFMPPWTPQVCEHWRAMLDRLEQDAPASVAKTLDWAIKYSLYTDRLLQRGLSWEEVSRADNAPQWRALRQELFEIDVRYSQLGERGIFTQLDRAGVLDHRFPGVDNIEHAIANPPAIGRGRLRGELIKRLCGEQARYDCYWTGVWDNFEQKYVNLGHPFAATEEWMSSPEAGTGGN